MWLRKLLLIVILVLCDCCGASNASFNEQIREYSTNDSVVEAHTLQKEGIGLARYTSVAPLQNPVRLKEVPDNALSASSHGRGLPRHDNNGYGIYEYEEPHYGHGYEYEHLPHHDYHHGYHDDHHVGHHGYGHHHKHYDHHALAAKTLLWPIAGIALLGAAAAFVTNPVLLQLGVVSGRKKRQAENIDFVKDSINKWTPELPIKMNQTFYNIPEFMVKRKTISNSQLRQKVEETTENVKDKKPNTKVAKDKHKRDYKILKVLSKRYTDDDEANMVQVPLEYKEHLINAL